jgi:hypothetical protein
MISFNCSFTYRPGHPKQEKLSQAVCEMVISTFVPTSFVDAPGFRNVLEIAEPQFRPPTRNTVKKYINNTWPSMKAVIIKKAAGAREIHATADIWSTRACKASCLGITVHFFNPETKKRETYAIACRDFPSPHTGVRIAALLRKIAEEFGIFPKLR